jgi:hypothetical protein
VHIAIVLQSPTVTAGNDALGNYIGTYITYLAGFLPQYSQHS